MKTILTAALVGFLAAFVGVKMFVPAGQDGLSAARETAYERVMRTGVLRCGYFVAAPYLMKDVQTGKFSGIWHDYTEALAADLGLKVEWAEEMGLGDFPTALNNGRIDAYCAGLWSPGARIKVVNYLDPTAFEAMLPYVRVDDHRFDNDLSLLNNKDIKVSTIDGEGGGMVADEDFPLATKLSLPQLSNMADMFNQVVFKKADVFFTTPSAMLEFEKNNPGKLRALADKPLRVFPVSLAVKNGEDTLRHMLNMAGRNVLYNGKMDKILTKYEGDGERVFWRVTPAYVK